MMRHDLYRRPHKALRAWMSDTLVALGRVDPLDDCEVREGAERLEELMAFCEKHAAIENEFVHRAIEDRRKDASRALAIAHVGHAAAIEELRLAARRRDPMLHRRVAAFVADNLRHMEDEEGPGNALLWELFSDAELQEIEARIVASIAPGDAMQAMRWMLPALNHPERVALLEGFRRAPPGVLQGAMAVAQSHLRAVDFAKLDAALAQREPATLES